MNTLEAIQKRASLKSKISSRPIEPENIQTILEAARVAPSAGNRQPWYFVVVDDREAVKRLVGESFNLEVNAEAQEAPVILVAFSDPKQAGSIDERDYSLFDVGLAAENIVLAATDLGLVTHLMTNLDQEALKRVLGVPDNIRFVAATPIAYPASSYEEAARERLSKRKRKQLGEIVYWNGWGHTHPARGR